jgi:predicted alpha/beta hydrolase family esterase
MLEERDRYFSMLKATIEELVRFNQKPAIVIAHSMGNNVFLYFTEWMKLEYPNYWEKWFDSHVSALFAIAAPLLGSPSAIRCAVRP